MLTWTERATLFKTLAVLWTQHRWCLVLGKTSSMAFQKPSAPSPTARSGAISSPRCLMSMRSSRQLCALSRTPVWKPTSSFLPSGVAPISTSMQSALSSIGPAGRPRPNIHVLPCREIPLLPSVIIRLPLRRQPRDHGRRVWRVLAQEGGEPLLKIAGRHPAQVENRQSASRLLVRRAHFGRIADVKRIFSRNPASQAVRERRKHIGKVSRGFRRRQRYLQALSASGWISLDPGMFRGVGIVGSRQSGNNLRTNLHQGLPWIGTRVAQRRCGPASQRGRHLGGTNILICIFHRCRIIGSNAALHFLGRRHGLALAHVPSDVFHVLHEAVEARTAERNLATAAVENPCR